MARQFGGMADAITFRLGDHRKTEARREKSARALLSGDPKIARIYSEEEVITILPGKRHISLEHFLRRCHSGQNRLAGSFTVVVDGFDVPKGEVLARQGVAVIVHPKTLERFGCYNAHELREGIDRIHGNLREDVKTNHTRFWGIGRFYLPELIPFSTLSAAYVEHSSLVSEREALDKEPRRAWTALRNVLQHYSAINTGGIRHRGPRVRGGKTLQILLGESATAEAWTDGSSYIAINTRVVQQLKSRPLKTVMYIFSLVEHEVAHEGDSLDCDHDEAFYQRFHDIALKHAEDRQWYMHLWLMRYTTSMENEGKRASGEAWRERFLVDRAGICRGERGLEPAIDYAGTHPIVMGPAKPMP